MSDAASSPNRAPDPYERPSQKWVCGRASEGLPCRIGPDQRGRCRASFECTPALETKAGEQKGLYRCTRPEEFGGPCETGPRQDGTCSRSVPKCQPVRSWPARRRAFTTAVIFLAMAALLLGLSGRYRYTFINPGSLSFPHSGTNFMGQFRTKFPQALAEAGPAMGGAACGACHSAAHLSPQHWVKAALQADPNPLQIAKLGSVNATDVTRMDQACLVCHTQHLFHQTNVVANHSCSACHREHQGPGRMAAPTSAQCASCHGNAAVMAAAAAKAKALPASSFAYQPVLGQIHFQAPRPPGGYTQVIHSFSGDHPEFQLKREHAKDPDTLKFNHQRHFANDIPRLKGQPLTCQTCHQLDASGTYFVKMRYETQCQACHGLQFEWLTLPHGNPAAVRAFLNSLGRQYEDYASVQRDLPSRRERETFVTNQLYKLRTLRLSGRDFEKEVFFSTKNSAPAPRVSTLTQDGPPYSYGCAYCHEVTSAGSDVPIVTKPFIAERWLLHGSFNHLRHTAVACERCHEARQSRETSDILLPSKATCAECHSRSGGVAEDCSVCHRFHNGIGR